MDRRIESIAELYCGLAVEPENCYEPVQLSSLPFSGHMISYCLLYFLALAFSISVYKLENDHFVIPVQMQTKIE